MGIQSSLTISMENFEPHCKDSVNNDLLWFDANSCTNILDKNKKSANLERFIFVITAHSSQLIEGY